jgi:cytochrome oxidase Cu insertion factor (SCO1/SenC/PrrC family)
MTRRTRVVQWAAPAVAIGVAAAVFGYFLLTPARGEVLLLLTARQAERVAATSVELHSAQGWIGMGSIRASTVPKAPETAEAFTARVPVGSYDRVRMAGVSVPLALNVQRDLLNTLLVGISAGRPMPNSAYGGSEAVSLGLNELAGQLKPMPPFSLVDQFGRAFTNADIAGHDVLLAAFHTSCRETCPLVTGLFLKLRERLPPSVMLIQATVTPSQDTPAVLREYAGRVGASWTFITGEPEPLAAFWAPFHVGLDTRDSHVSTIALIDSHGYIRTYFLGAPDVGAKLPPALDAQLDDQGRQLLTSRGNGWGDAQILDALQAVGGLAHPTSSGQGLAPGFTLMTLDGRRMGLTEYRGRPVLINFWATYCAPCRREMPLLERMAAEHPRLVVLLIDERDSHQSASAFVTELQITSAVLFDGDGKVGDAYGISGLPTTYFIRPDGNLEGRYIGETNAGILGPHISAIGA